MNRTSELICFFAERLPMSGTSQLRGYLYLADWQSRRYLGRPLTDLVWTLGDDGPTDTRVALLLNELTDAGYLAPEPSDFSPAVVSYRRTARPLSLNVEPAEQAVLNSVLDLLCRPGHRNLLADIIRQTEPVRDAVTGQPLQMALVDGAERVPGMELEDVLQADADLKAGKGIPLSVGTSST
jgi:hypothetical protein